MTTTQQVEFEWPRSRLPIVIGAHASDTLTATSSTALQFFERSVYFNRIKNKTHSFTSVGSASSRDLGLHSGPLRSQRGEAEDKYEKRNTPYHQRSHHTDCPKGRAAKDNN